MAGELAQSIQEMRRFFEELSATLEQVVMRCLEKQPAARYAKASELADALSTAQREGLTAQSTHPSKATASTPSALHLR